MKTAIVFWSGTGNTEAMAQAVAEGTEASGAQVNVLTCDKFNESMIDDYDSIVFGCPSMGAEQLEEDEFDPMFSACVRKLGGKKIALFGSYGWGDGEWMRNWQDECESAGAVLTSEPVICNDAPDDEAVAACKALGKSLIN
ncbi:MAG: flavodoxin [Ruminococcus sp.]|nr:flavodoxin [Ruminococcus sp.]